MKQNINKQLITIGSDPEAFLRNRETKEIVSAIGLIPGSKYEPVSLHKEIGQGFFIQTDNVMVEWCVPACNTAKELYDNIQKCIKYTNDIIPAELEVVLQPSAILDSKYLEDDQAKTFGCEPSYNAWTYQMNKAPSNKTNLRTCGGHIHIGYENPNDDTSINLIRALDLYLNIPSLILDSDKDRKKMYGKAGEFRIKDYGVEYRGLSNYWANTLSLTKFIFAGIDKAVDFINSGKELNDEDQFVIQETINNNDKVIAHKLITKFQLDQVLSEVYTID